MKIGFDLRTLAEGKITGVEIYTRSLLNALLNLDQANEYRLFFNAFNSSKHGLLNFEKKNVTLCVRHFPNRLLNLSMLVLKSPKIDKLLGEVDIFFSPRYLFTAVSGNCPLVVTVHDLSFIHFPNFFSRKQRLWHSIVSDKSACLKAAAVIAVSDATKNDLLRTFGLDRKKVFAIHPGLDHLKYHARRDSGEEATLKTFYGLRRPFILYLGTIEPRKNILGVIAGFEKLMAVKKYDLDLVLAGGLGWLYNRILKRIETSPFKDRIRLLGRVPEKLKPSLYRMAEVFVFPSFFEGFGFPPLEAAACGTPVVVAHNSSAFEVMQNAALYANPYDAGQIAVSLENFLSDSELKSEYVSRGLERVKNFTWDKTARQTLEVFNQVRKIYA